MSRTVSARIPTELHRELRERCNLIGESINDFIKASIEIALYRSTDFDFGEEQDVKPAKTEPELKKEPPLPEITIEGDSKSPEMKITSINGKPVEKNSEGKYVYT